jgi:hypothetical protein
MPTPGVQSVGIVCQRRRFRSRLPILIQILTFILNIIGKIMHGGPLVSSERLSEDTFIERRLLPYLPEPSGKVMLR